MLIVLIVMEVIIVMSVVVVVAFMVNADGYFDRYFSENRRISYRSNCYTEHVRKHPKTKTGSTIKNNGTY